MDLPIDAVLNALEGSRFTTADYIAEFKSRFPRRPPVESLAKLS
jgi:hypothetical protein